jgi:hypothetical protein
MIFQPFTVMIWDCLIVGLLWLHHIQSLADVTVANTAIGKEGKLLFSTTSCWFPKAGRGRFVDLV